MTPHPGATDTAVASGALMANTLAAVTDTAQTMVAIATLVLVLIRIALALREWRRGPRSRQRKDRP